ncbi:hypothetical protein KIN20_000714 [Parelaphostrongylus tenuis]|uniref:Uncharacterized protein n=1 Tax=Parelaphostrongylus tenuis TaxID=148309 RepID=A0AAD5QE28_PARTN|nr:hypothetical protein KIN20_000714 [Parelaphostrongylus tenuis]
MQFFRILSKCRDLPLIEYKNDDELDEELLRRRKMRGLFTKENIFFMCPLDFSRVGFDEEAGNQLLPSSELDNSSDVIERRPTHSPLYMLDSAAITGNNSAEDCGSYIIVDKNSTVNKSLMERILERLHNIGTPYESYTIATNLARKKEAEEKSKHGDQPVTPEIPKKLYTHHDPPTERPIMANNLDVNEADIALKDREEATAKPFFADSQILTKKKLKQARKARRENVDIPTEISAGEGPSYSKKRIKSNDEFEKGNVEIQPFDYSQVDPEIFSKPPALDNSFDPFNQKYRLENKKNFRRRPRGGHHRMGTMSIGYTPTTKK